MKKAALVRCFDPLIDVPCAVLEQLIVVAGYTVRPVSFTGGGVDIYRGSDFFVDQFATLQDRGFNIAVVTAHKKCHHVRVHNRILDHADEDSFLNWALEAGAVYLESSFLNMEVYVYSIDTENAIFGAKAIHPLRKKDKDFFHASIAMWGEQLFPPVSVVAA